MVALVYVLDGALRWVDRPKRRPGRLRGQGNPRNSQGSVDLLPVNLTFPRTPHTRRDRTLLLWCNGHRREVRVGIGRLEDVVAATDSQVVYI